MALDGEPPRSNSTQTANGKEQIIMLNRTASYAASSGRRASWFNHLSERNIDTLSTLCDKAHYWNLKRYEHELEKTRNCQVDTAWKRIELET